MSILGIIPARAGSKGIKNKNFIKINKKILIQYTIDEAKKSKLLDKIIITSDSLKAKKISRLNKINFLRRPKNLAEDTTEIYPVIMHALNEEKKFFNNYDYVALLQPTTPLKKSFMIDEAIRMIKKEKADTVISVSVVEDNHPARMYRLVKSTLRPLKKNLQSLNRQKLTQLYHRDGNVYIFKVKSLIKYKNIYGKKIIPLILNRKYKLNIDDKYDLKFARMILK